MHRSYNGFWTVRYRVSQRCPDIAAGHRSHPTHYLIWSNNRWEDLFVQKVISKPRYIITGNRHVYNLIYNLLFLLSSKHIQGHSKLWFCLSVCVGWFVVVVVLHFCVNMKSDLAFPQDNPVNISEFNLKHDGAHVVSDFYWGERIYCFHFERAIFFSSQLEIFWTASREPLYNLFQFW